MWTYVHREFFLTIFGQCINVLNVSVAFLVQVQQFEKIIRFRLLHSMQLNINLSQASTLLVIHKINTKLSQMKTNHYFPV